MKKIVSAHLGDKIFQIEEDAYAYLNNVLGKRSDKTDLERQIADLLEQKLAENKPVITYPDVADVLYRLGFSAPTDSQTFTSKPTKKLYRRMDGKVIAGVCNGLGDYFEIDPVIMRVIFVLAFFFGSMGFWLYLILWIIIPKMPKLLNPQS